MMLRRSASVLVLTGWFLGCSNSRPADDAPPVATPSATVTPSTVASGSPISLTFRFAVAPDAPPFSEDYTVFVHVVDEDGRLIGADDHEPPTPTRQWKAGTTVEYSRSTFAPTSRFVGQATLVVGLYSQKSGQRVPLSGDTIEPRAIKVGSFEMRERADPYAVVFGNGWHMPESPEGAGVEWRWSTKSGALSFPNPKRASDLILQLDQPNDVFPIPQHVEVKLGESVADAFDLEPHRTELRRISLDPALLGDSQTVELTVVTDKTFVPARVAELRSSDTRQLGIRVFRAFVEPKQ
jgi:hypothetical protein